MTTTDGTPIWFELTTADQDRAQTFYQDVAGWTIAAVPGQQFGGYRSASASDGQGVAGVMKPPPGMDGVPGWTTYFYASDPDAKAEAVKAAGGSVLFGPIDIPGIGRFAVCADPQGVLFNIMRGDSPQASSAFKPMAAEAGDGHVVWIELATPDTDGALAFYGTLFGWTKQGSMPMGTMGEYIFFGSSESDRPGAIMSSVTTGRDPRWNIYVQVADIDAAIANITSGGGKLLQGPDEIPGGTFSINVADAEGYHIGFVGQRKAKSGEPVTEHRNPE